MPEQDIPTLDQLIDGQTKLVDALQRAWWESATTRPASGVRDDSIILSETIDKLATLHRLRVDLKQ